MGFDFTSWFYGWLMGRSSNSSNQGKELSPEENVQVVQTIFLLITVICVTMTICFVIYLIVKSIKHHNDIMRSIPTIVYILMASGLFVGILVPMIREKTISDIMESATTEITEVIDSEIAKEVTPEITKEIDFGT